MRLEEKGEASVPFFPTHPLVVHFPVALWLTSLLFDAWYWWRRDLFAARAGRLLVGLGLVGALASVAVGFADYRQLVALGVGGSFVRAHQTHALLAYGSTTTYALYLLSRWRTPEPTRWWQGLLGVAGAVLIALTGWYGGELRLVM